MIIIISYRLPLRIFKLQFTSFFLSCHMSNFKSFFLMQCSTWCELNIQIIFALLSHSLFVFPFKKKILSFNCWRVAVRWGKEIITMHTKNSKKRYFFVCARCRVKHVRERFNKQYRCFCLLFFHISSTRKKRKINGWRVRESKQAKKKPRSEFSREEKNLVSFLESFFQDVS